jgi:type VI secretion system protein ImpH
MPDIKTELLNDAPSFHVMKAIYIVEKLSRALHPERDEDMFDQTGIKFKPFEKYLFPPRDIRSLSFENDHFEFVMNFLGLYGINSAIPRCYHEQIVLQQPECDEAGEVPLQNFLDIFNNRFYWLYYLAWKKNKLFLHIKEKEGGKVNRVLSAFLGKIPSATPKSTLLSRFSLLKFSGIFSQRVRNKAGLQILLMYFFPQIKMRIIEFVPKWVKLTDVPSLGGEANGDVQMLGVNSFAGDRSLDYMSKIMIEIGPIGFDDFLNFLPNSNKAIFLNELLSVYLNDGLEYDVKLILNSETIIPYDWKDERLKLGTSIWMGKPKEKYIPLRFSFEEYRSIN